MLKGATIFYSVNLMNNHFLNMCQWNLSNLFDCVNKKKRLEATKLLFQQILLLNSVKYNFSLWLHYQISLSPCFVDNTTDKKTNEKFYFWSHFHTSVYMKLFAKEVTVSPTQYQQFEVPLSQKYGNITVQKSR